jgi:hypothetical protein
MKMFFMPVFIMCLCYTVNAQDDTIFTGKKVITLSDVVVDKNLDVPGFINKIKNDSSYYKAFRNLRVIGYSAINDIRMLDKKGGLKASLFSKTKQLRSGNCRTMDVSEEKVSGDC